MDESINYSVNLTLSDANKAKKIYKVLQPIIFDEITIDRIRDVFVSEMELALNEQPSSLQMENTYIPELPDGTEEGIFLALDLGGTNFRVIYMEIESGAIVVEKVHHYHIGEDLRLGCGDLLFDYLAECVHDFVLEQKLDSHPHLPLGFTFSFPMRQHSLSSGCLITWTKSFNCPSVVGEDVVHKLRDSLVKLGRLNVDVVAILNDTTGTLVQGAKLDGETRIGIVLGTGSNACYMENADVVKHWEGQRHGEKKVIIDIEWGAFGDNGVLDFIKSEFDHEVDNGSLLKNSFTFEKYIGGKYLGELCRVILAALHRNKLFMTSVSEGRFLQPWTFGSQYVSQIESNTVGENATGFDEVMETFGFVYGKDYTDDDVKILRYVCGLISKRAAQLLAINTSVLLNRMDEHDVTVAIDGSVYKHHPRLRHWIEQNTRDMSPTKNIKFMLAEDGSGKGAALVAAIAERIKNN